MRRLISSVLVTVVLGLGSAAHGQLAAGTEFTYQGQLLSGGAPANGSFDVRLSLFAASSGGVALGTGAQTFAGLSVANGLFTVKPDFGPAMFSSDARYLQVEVRPAGGGAYTALSPRQALTGTPYAMGLVVPTTVTGATTMLDQGLVSITQTNVGTAMNLWNTSTDGAAETLLVVCDYGQDAIYAVNANGQTGILAQANVGNGVVGISGGTGGAGVWGRHDNGHGIGAGVVATTSSVDANAVGVLGSVNSALSGLGSAGVVGRNSGTTSNVYGVLGTVTGNTITTATAGVRGVVPLTTTSNGYGVMGEHDGSGPGVYGYSAFGAGVEGVSTGAVGVYGTGNSVNGNGVLGQTINGYGVRGVSNGLGDGMQASSSSGYALFAQRNGITGTTPAIRGECYSNDANAVAIQGEFLAGSPGTFSAAVRGHHAGTGGLGIGVWGGQDGSGWGVLGTAAGAGNGVRGEAPSTGWAGYFNNRVYAGLSLNIGSTDTSGGNPIFHSSGARLTSGGVWTNACDRNLKENFADVDAGQILEKVGALPISVWNYKAEGAGVTHIGPTAQDFRRAFHLGDNETTIGTVDADGVALAAIKGLRELIVQKDAQVGELRARNVELEARLRKVEAALARLEASK